MCQIAHHHKHLCLHEFQLIRCECQQTFYFSIELTTEWSNLVKFLLHWNLQIQSTALEKMCLIGSEKRLKCMKQRGERLIPDTLLTNLMMLKQAISQ